MTKKEEAFQVAINQTSKMDIIYVNEEGVRKKRRIWPLEFHNTQGKWRCLAWCEHAQGIRTFKMANTISYKVTARKFDKDAIETMMVKPDPEKTEPESDSVNTSPNYGTENTSHHYGAEKKSGPSFGQVNKKYNG